MIFFFSFCFVSAVSWYVYAPEMIYFTLVRTLMLIERLLEKKVDS